MEKCYPPRTSTKRWEEKLIVVARLQYWNIQPYTLQPFTTVNVFNFFLFKGALCNIFTGCKQTKKLLS